MKAKLFLFTIFVLLQCAYTSENTVTLDIPYYYDPYIQRTEYVIYGEDGNILKYHIFNLFDQSLSTALALRKNEFSKTGVDLAFSKEFLIDKIVVYNGYQKTQEIYKKNNRIKELALEGFSRNDQDRFLEVFTTNVELSDTMGYSNVIILNNDIKIWNLYISAMSTYPGTKYDDTCISEIEFWYQGQKYEIANLEEAKKEFLAKYREQQKMNWMGWSEVYTEQSPDQYHISSRTNQQFIQELAKGRKNIKKLLKKLNWPEDTKKFYFLFSEKGELYISPTYKNPKKTLLGYWKIGSMGELLLKLDGKTWVKGLEGSELAGIGMSGFWGDDENME